MLYQAFRAILSRQLMRQLMQSCDAPRVCNRHNDRPSRPGGSAAARYLPAKLYGHRMTTVQGLLGLWAELACFFMPVDPSTTAYLPSCPGDDVRIVSWALAR